jgi:hypothetical protein
LLIDKDLESASGYFRAVTEITAPLETVALICTSPYFPAAKLPPVMLFVEDVVAIGEGEVVVLVTVGAGEVVARVAMGAGEVLTFTGPAVGESSSGFNSGSTSSLPTARSKLGFSIKFGGKVNRIANKPRVKPITESTLCRIADPLMSAKSKGFMMKP